MQGSDSKAEAARRLVLGELGAVNRQDPHGLADHFSEDCEFVDHSDGSTIDGKPDFLADLVDLFSRVPDLHVVEKRLAVEGGVVAAEILLAGTHVSEWRGHEPSGAEFRWHTCSFYDLHPDGEHLLRERMYYDAGRLDRQLAQPAPASR
ncbi:MAG TPA: ester cyclase [Solirubrobacterales bacterium]|nr:ester cyclase [Solirubrobacterales bacterium]